MIVLISLRTGKPCGFAGGDNCGLEAVSNLHDRGENVLNICNPQVKCTCAKYQLGRYGV